jgi:hypothetical protein
MTHPATFDIDALLKQCQIGRSRCSGPGGQHRNKVETAVLITHTATGVTGSASERRSQADNRRVALFRLRLNLALEVRSPKESTPSGRFRVPVNSEHDDFPAVLAAALDAVDHHAYDVKAAAGQLGCSMSQLLKLLNADPRALKQVNVQRQQRDLRPLRR